ncbi:hypothetical protein DVH05_027533 [Phytophthora capsici]|nr:hypothetical protein DVH05_027533 [Phytophthora capsici]
MTRFYRGSWKTSVFREAYAERARATILPLVLKDALTRGEYVAPGIPKKTWSPKEEAHSLTAGNRTSEKANSAVRNMQASWPQPEELQQSAVLNALADQHLHDASIQTALPLLLLTAGWKIASASPFHCLAVGSESS